jgi:hypothetical protein
VLSDVRFTPKKRTSLNVIAMSAKRQKRTFRAAANNALFDHLVGAGEQRWGAVDVAVRRVD